VAELDDGPPTPEDARALWRVCEPLHAASYVAVEVRDALRAAGLRGFWTGYLAARLAPLGPVGPEVAASVLPEYAPEMLADVVPATWERLTPSEVLAARAAALPAALAPFLGDLPADRSTAVTATLEAAVRAAAVDGRPLFAANAALPWPPEPDLRLWHAATLLREHREDGRLAVLTAADLTGLEALALTTAVRGSDPAVLRDEQGWDVARWRAATSALAVRGLVDRSGAATAVGHEEHAALGAATDRAAARMLVGCSRREVGTAITVLAPIAQRIAATGLVPFPNPVRPRHPDPDR
jgi:hypothetical protein